MKEEKFLAHRKRKFQDLFAKKRAEKDWKFNHFSNIKQSDIGQRLGPLKTAEKKSPQIIRNFTLLFICHFMCFSNFRIFIIVFIFRLSHSRDSETKSTKMSIFVLKFIIFSLWRERCGIWYSNVCENNYF